MFESPLKSNRIVALDNLIPHPDNYRQHPDEQVQKLVLSLQRFGQGRSIVIQDSPGKQLIVAGHGIVEAAKLLDWPELRADILPADWTSEQVKGYLIADNQHAQGASDDDEILSRLLQEQQDLGIDLASLGTDDETLRQMLESLGDEYLVGDESEEDAEEDEIEDAPARCLYGDLWKLGEHLLLVGDSTNQEDVQRLMQGKRAKLLASDPPYNVGIRYGESTDDSKQDVVYETFSKTWFHLWQSISDFQIVTPGCYNLALWLRWFDAYHWAPWTKTNSMTNGRVSRFWCWEPVLFFGTGWKRVRANDVFDFPIGAQKEVGNHPCPKPLKMWVDLLEHYTDANDIIADAFGGSGTTLIAAELTDRIARICEIETKYADIIIARYEVRTGHTAQLLDRVEEVTHA